MNTKTDIRCPCCGECLEQLEGTYKLAAQITSKETGAKYSIRKAKKEEAQKP